MKPTYRFSFDQVAMLLAQHVAKVEQWENPRGGVRCTAIYTVLPDGTQEFAGFDLVFDEEIPSGGRLYS